MLTALLFLAASEAQPATQVQLQGQARLCGVSLEHLPREQGYNAYLSEAGKVLTLRGNQPPAGLECLAEWGERRRMMVVIAF